MTLTDQEKRIVLSISEGRQASQILNKKQLAQLLPQSDNMEEKIGIQLEIYARSLRKYTLPFLKSDFSQWLTLWEYHVEKLIVENTRDGLPEFVPVVITDDNGKFRVIGKQHVFKQNLEYISELKGE